MLVPELSVSSPQFSIDNKNTWQNEFPSDIAAQSYTLLFALIGYQSLDEMDLLKPNASEKLKLQMKEWNNSLQSVHIRYPIKLTVLNKGKFSSILMSSQIKVTVYSETKTIQLSDLNIAIAQGQVQEISQLNYIELSNTLAEPIVWHYIFDDFDGAINRLLRNNEEEISLDLLELFLMPPKSFKSGFDSLLRILGKVEFLVECVDNQGNLSTNKALIDYVRK